MSTAPTHNPTKEPKGDNPFIFVNDDGSMWSWDFIKNIWFKFDEDELEKQPTIGGKRVFIDEEIIPSGPPKKKQKNEKKQIEQQKSGSIFVENLPSDTTFEEIVQYFSKTGLIKKDEYTGDYKIKLYKDEDGSLKGEALITYFKPESVELAISILDGSDFRYKRPIKVTEVC